MPSSSKTRTPIRLLASPSRTPRFGSLFCAKKSLSASASFSGSRSSPPTTIPGSSGPRASWTSCAEPLLSTRAAASCEAPIFRPTSFLCVRDAASASRPCGAFAAFGAFAALARSPLAAERDLLLRRAGPVGLRLVGLGFASTATSCSGTTSCSACRPSARPPSACGRTRSPSSGTTALRPSPPSPASGAFAAFGLRRNEISFFRSEVFAAGPLRDDGLGRRLDADRRAQRRGRRRRGGARAAPAARAGPARRAGSQRRRPRRRGRRERKLGLAPGGRSPAAPRPTAAAMPPAARPARRASCTRRRLALLGLAADRNLGRQLVHR